VNLDAAGKLSRLAELAQEFRSTHVAEEATTLAQRLREGRFYVACIGQFKRGKSTILNALVEDGLLPTGTVPVTTVPTILRYGETRGARVRFRGGEWTDAAPENLKQYVSEEYNPENTKGVAGVEVFLPSALLADGMCFVDTPGLGSIFAGNSAATEGFVPHIDAAVIVVGADPPIGGEELTVVEAIGKQVEHVIVVLNKADRTTDEERNAAVPFTRNVLEKGLRRTVGPIYEISAYERVTRSQSTRDWGAFVQRLQGLAAESGRILIRRAGERGLRRIGEELLAILIEERGALVRPMEESERRITALGATMAEAQQSMREMSYLFMAEMHHLSDALLERRKQFLDRTDRTGQAALHQECGRTSSTWGPRFRRQVTEAAQKIAAQRVLPWLADEQKVAEQEYRQVAERFVRIGNDFLSKLAQSKLTELARMPNALNAEEGFRAGSHFRFEKLIHVAQPASPLRYLADVFIGLIGAHGVIEKESAEFLDYLMEMNSSRVQADVMERVQGSQAQLEGAIRKLLHEVTRIAADALEHAREVRGGGAAVVEEKLARISEAEQEVQVLMGK
jgi:Dynamin family